MDFSLLTMGTASALPTANRYSSAHILKISGRLFLLDCGEGAQMQMRRYGVSFNKIDNIFISHIHGDHIFGLFGFLSTLAMSGRISPLNIFASEGFSNILSFFLSQFGEGIKYPINHVIVKCKEPTLIYETKNVDIYSFPLVHRCETYGYLFKEKDPQLNVHKHLIETNNLTLYEIARLKEGNDIIRDSFFIDESGEQIPFKQTLLNKDFTYKPFKPRSFAYCTDTQYFKRLSQWIKGVDLLYHDSTYTNEFANLAKTTLHSTSAQAATCAKEAGVGKLILGHYSSRYKSLEPLLEEAKVIFPDSYLSKEGTVFEIPLERVK
jgi:Metal-dependent hydrolases of the beta-lactamase superfamily III